MSTVFIFNIFEYMLSILSSILVIKKLSVIEYGAYNFLNTTASLILVFFTLGLAQYNNKIIPGREIEIRYQILGNGLFFQFVFSIVGIALFFFIFSKKISLDIVYIFFTLKILLSLFNHEFMRFIGYEKKMILKSFVGLFDSKLWVLFLLLYFLLDSKVTISRIFLVQCINSTITLILCLVLLSPRRFFKNFKFSSSFLNMHLKKAIAFVLVDMGMYFLEISVRYVLVFRGSELSLGLFSFAYNWIMIIFKFGMLFIYILQPYLSQSHYSFSLGKSLIEDFYKLENIALKYSIYILTFALAYFIIFFHDLVVVVGKADYIQTKMAVIFLSPLVIFMCISYYLQIIILLGGKYGKIPACYFCMVGINIILNIVFVPKYDYYAAAIINSFSYFILMILLILNVPDKMIRLNISAKACFVFLSEFVSFIILMALINRMFIMSLLIKLSISIVVILFYMFFIISLNKKDFVFLSKNT